MSRVGPGGAPYAVSVSGDANARRIDVSIDIDVAKVFGCYAEDVAHLLANGWRYDGDRWRDPGMGAAWSTEMALREQARRDERGYSLPGDPQVKP